MQIELAETFADQAVIAIENVPLCRVLVASLPADVLKVISPSTPGHGVQVESIASF